MMRTIVTYIILILLIAGALLVVSSYIRGVGTETQTKEIPATEDKETHTNKPHEEGSLKSASPQEIESESPEDLRFVEHPRIDPSDFHSGIAIILYRTDYENMEDLKWKSQMILDRLAENFVNSISINIPFVQNGIHASEVGVHPKITPTLSELAVLVEEAHKREFSVMIRPILDETYSLPNNSSEWRGTIRPTDKDKWFSSYTKLLLEYAEFAEDQGVDFLVIGAELVSMERYSQNWENLIREVRATYDGQITYSSNRGISDKMPWEKLDFIGVDAFFELHHGHADPTSDELITSWEPWVDALKEKANKIGKPLVLTEIGTTSQKNSWQRPWVWDHKEPPDMYSQEIYYSSSCDAWRSNAHGIYWWGTSIWLLEYPRNDAGYNPIGKPAEKAIKNCFRK